MLAVWHRSGGQLMRSLLPNLRRRNFSIGLLLVALLLRAYIPVGFMPANGTPFLLELCPAATPMPASMSMSMPAHHHHHSDSHNQFQVCPFGSAPAPGPVSHLAFFAPPPAMASRAIVAFTSLRPQVHREAAHQPRGPPSLA
jgi:hypothetical protein